MFSAFSDDACTVLHVFDPSDTHACVRGRKMALQAVNLLQGGDIKGCEKMLDDVLR